MSDERTRILDMLARGLISATEAADLLDALQQAPAADPTIIDADSGAIIEPAPVPDFTRFRHFWVYPFAVSVGVLALAGLGLAALYAGSGFWATLGLICVWPILLLAIAGTLLSVWSRYAPWIHVRVQQRSGRRIAISLPVPLGAARWGLRRARRYVPKQQSAQLDAAAALLDGLTPGRGDPLMIDVDDEDGERVQVFIG